jgi:GNAT superfamily N-acetyltransferase
MSADTSWIARRDVAYDQCRDQGEFTPHGNITYGLREPFTNDEIHVLHAAAFERRLFGESEWDWVDQTQRHSLGWVVARDGERFVGFVNVLWDGLVHPFIEDVMVDADYRHSGLGVSVVHAARDGARVAGREFLHAGFDEDLQDFYLGAWIALASPEAVIERLRTGGRRPHTSACAAARHGAGRTVVIGRVR